MANSKQFNYYRFGYFGILGVIIITSVLLLGLNLFYSNPPPVIQSPSIKLQLPAPQDIPILMNQSVNPPITAQSAIVIDPNSATVLFEKSADTKMLPASTTKIMTALIALEEYDLEEVVTVTNANESIGHKALIRAGEQLTVKDLLYALMINSGNDAAVALAQHHPQGYQHFVDLMNKKARLLHLNNSHFTNVSGIEDPKHYMSARDLAVLTKEAMQVPLFAQIVGTQSAVVTSLDGQVEHRLENLNELLGKIDGVKGVKTGWTELAGECLVAYTERNNHPIITVVLKSSDRFGETASLIDWVYQNHAWMPYQDLIKEISY